MLRGQSIFQQRTDFSAGSAPIPPSLRASVPAFWEIRDQLAAVLVHHGMPGYSAERTYEGSPGVRARGSWSQRWHKRQLQRFGLVAIELSPAPLRHVHQVVDATGHLPGDNLDDCIGDG